MSDEYLDGERVTQDPLRACESPPRDAAEADNVLGYLVRTVHRLDIRTAVDHAAVQRHETALKEFQDVERTVTEWRAQLRLLKVMGALNGPVSGTVVALAMHFFGA